MKGHIAPNCKNAPKQKEVNRYMSGSFYAVLEVVAQAYKDSNSPFDVSIFIDNGCSLNGISEDLDSRLQLTINEGTNDVMNVDLGFGQTVSRPPRTAEMCLKVPGFSVLRSHFQVMPIPEGKDVILGMMWLHEQNPDINWSTLKLTPREQEVSLQLQTPRVRPSRNVAGRRQRHQSQ